MFSWRWMYARPSWDATLTAASFQSRTCSRVSPMRPRQRSPDKVPLALLLFYLSFLKAALPKGGDANGILSELDQLHAVDFIKQHLTKLQKVGVRRLIFFFFSMNDHTVFFERYPRLC